MGEKLTVYDPAEDLLSDEAIAVFMEEAFKTEDAGYIAHALGVVARAKGMTQIASETGLSREQLYRSFSANGNPTLKTTIAVMKALGIELTAKRTSNDAHPVAPSRTLDPCLLRHIHEFAALVPKQVIAARRPIRPAATRSPGKCRPNRRYRNRRRPHPSRLLQ